MKANAQIPEWIIHYTMGNQRGIKRFAKKRRSRWVRRQVKKAIRNNDECPLDNRYDKWAA
jgi:hypothetical protein